MLPPKSIQKMECEFDRKNSGRSWLSKKPTPPRVLLYGQHTLLEEFGLKLCHVQGSRLDSL